jgi:hypothetical protein
MRIRGGMNAFATGFRFGGRGRRVFACAAYFYFSNKLLDLALPVRDGDIRAASKNLNRRSVIRPWLFLFPALFLLVVYLVYPVIATLILSFYDRSGVEFVGFNNYKWAFGDREFRQSIFNNILWLAVVPAACTFFGLVIAVMTDRIWWGNIAKSIVFMPMAISFVGASVIWKFIYEYRGSGTQIGLLNAIVQLFRRHAAGVDLAALLEQLLPDGDPDLDPDRLRHGHPVGRPARHSRRKPSRPPSSTAPMAGRSSGRSWCRRSGARSPSSGPPSPSSCSRSSTSC